MALWTDEYFKDLIIRHIKKEISMKFFVKENRHPTIEDYKYYMNLWTNITFDEMKINNYDLGISDE